MRTGWGYKILGLGGYHLGGVTFAGGGGGGGVITPLHAMTAAVAITKGTPKKEVSVTWDQPKIQHFYLYSIIV